MISNHPARSRSMSFRCHFVSGIACLLCFTLPTASAQVFKCTDDRGRTTYSQQPCMDANRVERVEIRENTIDSSGSRRESALMHQRLSAENAQRQAARDAANAARRSEAQSARSNAGSSALCREMQKPIPGSRGMTAAQRESVLAACGGIAPPSRDRQVTPSTPSASTLPVPQTPRPNVITNCDAGGCWDDVGGRYNRGAGSTFFPAAGGAACQLVGGAMQCP